MNAPYYLEKKDYISEVRAGLPDLPDGTSLPWTVTESQQLLSSYAQQRVLLMGEQPWG